MDKRTKSILSIIGFGAIIVPAILLIISAGKAPKEPEISSGTRTIDTSTIEKAVKKPSPIPPEFPTPSPSTASASPISGATQ